MLEIEARLYRFSLGYARLLIADLDDHQMSAQPPGMTLNHAAWVLGHLSLGASLASRLLDGPSLVPDDWRAKYGPSSTISNNRDDHPSKEVLWNTLEQSVLNVCDLAPRAKPERLEQPHQAGLEFLKGTIDSVGDLLAHLMTTHQSTHLGQLSAWRRALGLPHVLPM